VKLDTFLIVMSSSSSSKDRERDRSDELVASFTAKPTVNKAVADAVEAVLRVEAQNIRDFLADRYNWAPSHDKGVPVMITGFYESVLPIWIGSSASAKRRISTLVCARISPKIELTAKVDAMDDNVRGYVLTVNASALRDEGEDDDIDEDEDAVAIDEDIEKQVRDAGGPVTTASGVVAM